MADAPTLHAPIPRDEFGRLRDGPSVDEVRRMFTRHLKPGADRTGQRLGVWIMLAGGRRGDHAWLARGPCGHEQVVDTRYASCATCRVCREARKAERATARNAARRAETSGGRSSSLTAEPRAAAGPAGRDRGALPERR